MRLHSAALDSDLLSAFQTSMMGPRVAIGTLVHHLVVKAELTQPTVILEAAQADTTG